MTKQIFIPSALIFAAGCTTSMEDFASDDMMDIEASAKTIDEPVEGPHAEIAQAMVDHLVASVSADKREKTLAMRSYAYPYPGGESGTGEMPHLCGEAPTFAELQVLESDCRDLKYQWGWEIEVSDCEIDDEVFSGTMRISYEELRNIPVLLPQDMVIEDAIAAVQSNLQGHASLRYELDLESSSSALHSCGQEFGPAEFRSSERKAHSVNLSDMSVEQSQSFGMEHALLEGQAAAPQVLSNRDGEYSISLEDGDTSRVTVSYLTVGVISEPGDMWPSQGGIEAHVEGYGNVRLRFTPGTPEDGTVEVDTPVGIILATLPME